MESPVLYVMINNALVPAATAGIQINDLAIQRGYGVFDFFKVVAGKPVFLDDHLERFLHSARELRLQEQLDKTILQSQIDTLLAANNLPESGIRLTLTGGYSSDGYTLDQPNLIISQSLLLLERVLPDPIQLITHSFQRQMPEVKTIDYLMAIWLKPELEKRKAQDVLYVSDGIVRECPRANFFIINEKGELQTTPDKILRGITRKKILSIAQTETAILTNGISLEDLFLSREAFICSTTKHIVPVYAIDGKTIGDGRSFEITRSLSNSLLKMVYGNML